MKYQTLLKHNKTILLQEVMKITSSYLLENVPVLFPFHENIPSPASCRSVPPQENISLTKDVQEMKASIENVQYSKHQLQTALNDTTRRLEEEDRVRWRGQAGSWEGRRG